MINGDNYQMNNNLINQKKRYDGEQHDYLTSERREMAYLLWEYVNLKNDNKIDIDDILSIIRAKSIFCRDSSISFYDLDISGKKIFVTYIRTILEDFKDMFEIDTDLVNDKDKLFVLFKKK